MPFNFPLYSIVFVIGGIIALIFSAIFLCRPSSPGRVPFTIFLIAIAWWTISRTFEAGGVDFATKAFWGKMMFFGTVNTGVMWFCFALDYTGSKWWTRPRHLVLLYLLPVLTLVVIWTNQYHHWFWSDIYFSPARPSVLVWEHAFWFWIFGVFEYAMLAVGTFILARTAFRREGILRRQIVTILIGLIFPVAGNLIYVFGRSPVTGLDLTPFGFLIAGVIYIVTIFRLRFLDLVPVARSALVENIPDGILVINDENYIADINPSAIKLLGLGKSSPIGKRLAAVSPRLDMIYSPEGTITNTEIALEAQGFTTYLGVSVTPIKDKKSKISGRLIVLLDITLHKLMEQRLRESESRYSALVEQSNEGVVIIQNSVYKYANRTMTEILGYSVEDIVGQTLPFAIAEEDIEMAMERYQRRQTSQVEPTVYELKMKRKDRQIIDTEVSVGNIFFDGQPAQMITIRDISERKLTQRKLEALYSEEHRLIANLKEEMEKRSRYTRALVHELRTPLTAILASSELLETEIKTKIPLALVKNIRRASLNLELRINELIELARGEIGMLKINPMPLDIRESIREIVSELTPVASAKGLQLTASAGDLPLVMGDRSRLRQVLTNLLSNAIKFTLKGAIQVTAARYDEQSVIVQVKDTGRGIDPEDIEYIFDPYRRKVNEGQELSGLGIGLALSKIFIDLHQGKIWVESSPEGSTFSFTIPIYKE